MTTEEENDSARKNRALRLAAYILMAAAGSFGLYEVAHIANEAEATAEDAEKAVEQAETAADAARSAAERTEAEALRRTFEICTSSNSDRDVILQLVLFTANSGGGRDFTQVPGWDDLDPTVQNFFQNLSSDNGDDGAESQFVQRARELLAPEDCDDL